MEVRKRRLYGATVYYSEMYLDEYHHLVLLTDGVNRKIPTAWRSRKYDEMGWDLQCRINFGFFGNEPKGNGAIGFEKDQDNIYHDWKTKGIRELVHTGNSQSLVLEDIWPDELKAKYPTANFIVSGGPVALYEGELTNLGGDKFTHEMDDHPRSWIAWKDNKVGLYVADGRQEDERGLNVTEIGQIAKDDGYEFAQMGDGGGSSAFIGDQSNVVNKPSDGHQRPVPNVLAFYVHPDYVDVPQVVKPDFEVEENQYILLLMEYIRFSQGRHGKGHSLDLAGKDTGKDILHAPFDLEVKRVYDYDNTVWAESLTKVWHANGTYDYATVQLTHANTLAFKVGDKFQQGEAFYPEGMRNASGNHIHVDIAVGKFVEPYGWKEEDPLTEAERIAGKTYTNMKRGWRLRNSVDPEAAWHLLEGYSTILDLKDVNLKVVDSMTKGDNIYEGTGRDKEKVQYQNMVDRLRVREQANPDSDTVGYLEKDAIYSIDSIRIKLEGEDAWTTFAPEWGDLLIPDQDVSEEVTRLRVELADCVKEKDSYKEQFQNQEATIEYLEDFVDDQEIKLAEYEARITELEKQLEGAKEDPERPEIDEDTHNFLIELLKKLFQ